MQLIKKHGIIIFWLILFADCFLLYQEKPDFHPYLKVLLVPVLLFYIFLNAKKNSYRVTKRLVFLGLLCAWIGDILLLNNKFFIPGMIAFVCMHVFYCFFFLKLHPITFEKGTEAFISLLAVAGIDIVVFKFLKEDLPSHIKIPFFVYMAAISVMAILAANVLGSKSRKTLALNFFVPAALLFMLSDTVLAINEFHYQEPFLEILIIMSYGYAQCLFAQGFTKYLKA